MPPEKRWDHSGAVDLGGLLESLAAAGIEFIVVGGLAAVAQGAPLKTMDVDIVHRQTKCNITRLLEFLRENDAVHRRAAGLS